jgi:adenylosuccinate synthase
MLDNIKPCDAKVMNDFDNIIFEGSQGLLLDQNNKEYFPNLTPSNTGMQNVSKLLSALNETEEKDIEIVYATRCYMTRHGAGKFTSEINDKPFEGIVDLTNVPNPYQGSLRYGLLDVDLLKQTIEKDLVFADGFKYNKSLAITCLDQIDGDVKYILDGVEHSLDDRTFLEMLEFQFPNYKLYFSYGMTRNTIKTK